MELKGKILLDNYTPVESFIKGRKNKHWFLIDDKKYLFKTGASNYEVFAELIASEFAHQCNIETADYYLASYNGEIGVITPNFLKQRELILSGDVILKYARQILTENNSDLVVDNSVNGICSALDLVMRDDYDKSEVLEQLIKYWAFDGLILESDRNETNWSIIKRPDGTCYIAPLYDYSTMCRMNNNIYDLVNSLNTTSVGNLIDNISYSLTFKSKEKNNNFLEEFKLFCIEYPELAENIISDFNNIDVDQAIKKVENKISKGEEKISFPGICNVWLYKVINYRLNELNIIYDSIYKNEKTFK